ncbi:hypothetical protein ACPV3S_17230 [Photobacterium damselae]|nr:hypothetical protein [Photobacterium damselae]AGE91766.1 hypothetical protein A613_p42 [Photobacterium damselae subsp. piscicida DI21]KAB1512003.1 pilus assembly protein PilP [Photobacterium damselae subsp. damselae]PSW82052.1 hypothetical protein CTN07_18340 [Photobacterium damselae]SPY43690.1 Uncharacterised protein [Photobacterium damselae]
MKKHIKWIILGVVTVPTIGYLFYPQSPAPSPVQPVSQDQNITTPSLPEPPKSQPSIVIQLDSNAEKIIQKSNELVQKKLDDALNKLDIEVRTPMTYQVPDMSKTFLTDEDTGFETPTMNPLDQVQFRGLIGNGKNQTAYLSIADNAPFKVQVGSIFQGIKVTRISPNGIEIRKGKQTRLLKGE